MKELTKYRVTGAVVLASIAVIFLPMLFDGDGLEHTESLNSEALDLRQTVDAMDFSEAVPDDISEVPGLKAALNAREVLREMIDEEGYLEDNDTRIGDPVLSIENTSTLVWAVQVGSFDQFDNATALRDRLLQDGYSAWLSNIRKDEGNRTRVAVGPMLLRADALAMQEELVDGYEGLEALIVGFSQ
ncbi:MAG: SPOR domain-containing protein [Pseudomonadales bacterium]